MKEEKQCEAVLKLCCFPIDCTIVSKDEQEAVYAEYTAYYVHIAALKKHEDIGFKTVSTGRRSVLQFWHYEGQKWPCLQKFATRIFCMAASSAASERNFLTYGFIHTKLRNSLGPDTVSKLVYGKD